MGAFGGNFGINFEGAAGVIIPVSAIKKVTADLCVTNSIKVDLCITNSIKVDLCTNQSVKEDLCV